MTDLVARLRDKHCCDNGCHCDEAAAEIERLRIENIQMQAALGYGILAEDERHIIPSNPFKCGVCDARARAKKDAPA
jgi:hypothetical protein